ncbi:NAD-dependent aldehyde dehydrogenase [Sparassis latifolia]
MSKYTPIDEIPQIHADLRAGFRSGKARSIAYRKQQLLQLAHLLKDNIDRFKDALQADLGRHPSESESAELAPTISEAMVCYHGVKKWAATERAAFSFNYAAMSPAIRKEPKGLVLIIGPFNYPILNLLAPFAGAIAAGNACMVKPSELPVQTCNLLIELFPKYLDQDLYRIVNGGVHETTKILELPFDHSSHRVGRIVATAAAKHLCPVSLELGGKSPVVVDPKCDLKTMAKRLMWGKFSNAGQTCVAPDYVLCPEAFQDKLIEASKEVLNTFYPGDPQQDASFGRIITEQHAERLKGLIDATRGTVVVGGQTDVAGKYVAPTIIRDVPPDDALMEAEIFGPILPIVPTETVEEAIAFINSREHPLALYVFSPCPAFKAKVFDNTQSGSAIANECNLHVVVDGLPFGGTGASGSGHYTGKFSFDMFTHLRSTMDNPSWVDVITGLRYPPYKSRNSPLAALTTPRLPALPRGGASPKRWGLWLALLFAGVAAALLTKAGRNALTQLSLQLGY